MTNSAMIDAAITHLSTGETKVAQFARIVQKQAHADVRNRIVQTNASLQTLRREAKATADLRVADQALNGINDNTDTRVERLHKPEYLFTFLQKIANQIMWSARAYKKAQEQEQLDALDNGIDFSQAVADDSGFDHTPVDLIAKQVDDAMRDLKFAQACLLDSRRMGYFASNVNDLRYHVVNVLCEETGEYEQRHTADSFDQALEVMENMLDANNERKEADLHKSDNDISFDDEDDGEEEVKEGPEFTAQVSDAA